MKKKLINIAKSYDFNSESEFYDYLIDSHLNGNFTQCRRLFAEMKREDQKYFVTRYLEGEIQFSQRIQVRDFYIELL